MSFYTDASLVMIPSGYKTSKVYSAKPVDGSGDLDFTRSNDTATRVNSSGLIEKVRTNVLLYSQDFSNAAYITTGYGNLPSVSVNTTANPLNGAQDADTATFTAAGTQCRLLQQFTGLGTTNKFTYSIYIKAGTKSAVNIYTDVTDTGRNASFNLSTGTIITQSAGVTASITSAGFGFYRCSVTTLPTTAGQLEVGIISLVGEDGSLILFGAQLELSDFGATDYIATTTATSVGPVANLPRLDYSGGATCPSLLLEPQRTNLATYSEQFDNAAWTKTAIAVTANSIASPDGYTNADFLVPTATNGLHSCIQPVGISSGTYTLSVFAKQGGYKNLLVWFDGHSGGVGVNLDTLAVFRNENNSGYSIDDFGNGWIRISVTITASGVANPNIYVYNNAATPAISFAGDGTSGIYLWGAQAEVGAYATSYIPTLSAALTRGQELCSKTGISSLLGQSEGTCFIEVDIQRSQDTRLPFLINSPNAATLTSEAYFYINGSNNLIFEVVTAGVPQCSISSGTATTGVQKLAFAYKNNDFVFYKNGVQVGVDTSGTVTSGFDSLYVGSYNANNLNLNEPIKQALVFKTRLSNASLASLTTL